MEVFIDHDRLALEQKLLNDNIGAYIVKKYGRCPIFFHDQMLVQIYITWENIPLLLMERTQIIVPDEGIYI